MYAATCVGTHTLMANECGERHRQHYIITLDILCMDVRKGNIQTNTYVSVMDIDLHEILR